MSKLVNSFNSKSDITLDGIIEFHAEFEYIHPLFKTETAEQED